jgi:2-polyprenyl-3-methyl-5-hydroxy-6-metoxy-1,4-benzoquinol methylase
LTDLAEIRKGWDHAASQNATFNILTNPDFKESGWPLEEFFAHGRTEIDTVIARLDELDLRDERRERAMDFGCGVGRLTQALAKHYRCVDGVDCSTEMVRQARQLSESKRVAYWLNTEPDLAGFDSEYDLVYSVITLQHMPPDLQQAYSSEFVRVLRPGGLAVFQLPEGSYLDHPQPWLSMWGQSRDTVEGWVTGAGGRILDVELSNHSGEGYRGWRYTAVKP